MHWFKSLFSQVNKTVFVILLFYLVFSNQGCKDLGEYEDLVGGIWDSFSHKNKKNVLHINLSLEIIV